MYFHTLFLIGLFVSLPGCVQSPFFAFPPLMPFPQSSASRSFFLSLPLSPPALSFHFSNTLSISPPPSLCLFPLFPPSFSLLSSLGHVGGRECVCVCVRACVCVKGRVEVALCLALCSVFQHALKQKKSSPVSPDTINEQQYTLIEYKCVLECVFAPVCQCVCVRACL